VSDGGNGNAGSFSPPAMLVPLVNSHCTTPAISVPSGTSTEPYAEAVEQPGNDKPCARSAPQAPCPGINIEMRHYVRDVVLEEDASRIGHAHTRQRHQSGPERRTSPRSSRETAT
jgi:hypothetical protein